MLRVTWTVSVRNVTVYSPNGLYNGASDELHFESSVFNFVLDDRMISRAKLDA